MQLQEGCFTFNFKTACKDVYSDKFERIVIFQLPMYMKCKERLPCICDAYNYKHHAVYKCKHKVHAWT